MRVLGLVLFCGLHALGWVHQVGKQGAQLQDYLVEEEPRAICAAMLRYAPSAGCQST